MRPSDAERGPLPDAGAEDELLPRFDRAERWAHRALGTLMVICLATAVALYVPDVSARIGQRAAVSTLHVAAGLLLPLPMIAALGSRAYRADLSVLNRFSPSDWEWLRSSNRRSGRIRVGKFNAGQKLNAAFTAGAVAVMLLTGSVMRLGASPDDWRSGATFVHDWLALAVAFVAVGHTWMAMRDPTARLGMRTGLVPRWWAAAEHAAWLDTLDGDRPRARPPH